MDTSMVVVEAGRTFAELARDRGDFADWVAAGLGASQGALRVVAAFAGESLPAGDELAAVVVTGSHAMVTERQGWSERLADWLAKVVAQGVPVLGICYGHQLLAHALGGAVGFHGAGGEFGTVEIRLQPAAADDPLFCDMPVVFPVQVFHRQSITKLPPGAYPLADSCCEAHQAVRFARHVWGVQFHPEFDAAIMAAYLDADASALARQGADLATLRATLRPSPAAGSLLRRFAQLALRGEMS